VVDHSPRRWRRIADQPPPIMDDCQAESEEKRLGEEEEERTVKNSLIIVSDSDSSFEIQGNISSSELQYGFAVKPGMYSSQGSWKGQEGRGEEVCH